MSFRKVLFTRTSPR